MRQFALVPLAVLGFATAAGCADRGGLDSHAALESSVAIRAAGCGTIESLGSGAVLAPESIVTVAHVVAGADSIVVVDRSGRHWPATISAIDTADDLAVLTVPGLAVPSLDLGSFETDDRGVYVTFDEQDQPVVEQFDVARRVRLTISDIYDEGEHRRRGLEIRADVNPGDSGAALVSPSGTVGGMVFASSRRDPERAWATDASEIEALLARRTHAQTNVACAR